MVNVLYAWVIPLPGHAKCEGIPAIQGPNGCMAPLMGTAVEDAYAMREEAQVVANFYGRPVRLVISSALETVETLHPEALPLNCVN